MSIRQPPHCVRFLTEQGCAAGNSCTGLHVQPQLCAGFPTPLHDQHARAGAAPAPVFDRPVRDLAWLDVPDLPALCCAPGRCWRRTATAAADRMVGVATLHGRSLQDMVAALGRPCAAQPSALAGSAPCPLSPQLSGDRDSVSSRTSTESCLPVARLGRMVAALSLSEPDRAASFVARGGSASVASFASSSGSVRSRSTSSDATIADDARAAPPVLAWAFAPRERTTGVAFAQSCPSGGGDPAAAPPPPLVVVQSALPVSAMQSGASPQSWVLACAPAHVACGARWLSRVLGVDYACREPAAACGLRATTHVVQLTCAASQLYACSAAHIAAVGRLCPSARDVHARIHHRRLRRQANAARRARRQQQLLGRPRSQTAAALRRRARGRSRSMTYSGRGSGDDDSTDDDEVEEEEDGGDNDASAAPRDARVASGCAVDASVDRAGRSCAGSGRSDADGGDQEHDTSSSDSSSADSASSGTDDSDADDDDDDDDGDDDDAGTGQRRDIRRRGQRGDERATSAYRSPRELAIACVALRPYHPMQPQLVLCHPPPLDADSAVRAEAIGEEERHAVGTAGAAAAVVASGGDDDDDDAERAASPPGPSVADEDALTPYAAQVQASASEATQLWGTSVGNLLARRGLGGGGGDDNDGARVATQAPLRPASPARAHLPTTLEAHTSRLGGGGGGGDAGVGVASPLVLPARAMSHGAHSASAARYLVSPRDDCAEVAVRAALCALPRARPAALSLASSSGERSLASTAAQGDAVMDAAEEEGEEDEVACAPASRAGHDGVCLVSPPRPRAPTRRARPSARVDVAAALEPAPAPDTLASATAAAATTTATLVGDPARLRTCRPTSPPPPSATCNGSVASCDRRSSTAVPRSPSGHIGALGCPALPPRTPLRSPRPARPPSPTAMALPPAVAPSGVSALTLAATAAPERSARRVAAIVTPDREAAGRGHDCHRHHHRHHRRHHLHDRGAHAEPCPHRDGARQCVPRSSLDADAEARAHTCAAAKTQAARAAPAQEASPGVHPACLPWSPPQASGSWGAAAAGTVYTYAACPGARGDARAWLGREATLRALHGLMAPASEAERCRDPPQLLAEVAIGSAC